MAIRERLITALITTYPDLDVLFMLDANALVITLVLTSPKYKMVVNEQSSATEREAFSVIVAVQMCRPYWSGSRIYRPQSLKVVHVPA